MGRSGEDVCVVPAGADADVAEYISLLQRFSAAEISIIAKRL
jgi:hypothetical protein